MERLEEKLEMVEELKIARDILVFTSFWFLVIVFILETEEIRYWFEILAGIFSSFILAFAILVLFFCFTALTNLRIYSVKSNFKKLKEQKEFLEDVEKEKKISIFHKNFKISVNTEIFSSNKDELILQKQELERDIEESLDCLLNSFSLRTTKWILQKLRLL